MSSKCRISWRMIDSSEEQEIYMLHFSDRQRNVWKVDRLEFLSRPGRIGMYKSKKKRFN